MKSGIISAVLAFALIVSSTVAAEDAWHQHVEAARAEGKKQNKKVLILIFGSQWDEASKAFKKELESEKLRKYCAQFEVAEMDLPDSPAKQNDEDRKAISQIVSNYMITAIPYMILLDEEGRSIGAMRYIDGDSSQIAYIIEKAMRIAKVRDAIMHVADMEQEPIEKARLIGEALSIIGQITPVLGYEKELQQIVELDKDDKLGLQAKLLAPIELNHIRSLLETRKTEEAIRVIEAFLQRFTSVPEHSQTAIYYRGAAAYQLGNMKEALEHMTVALGIAPQSAQAQTIRSAIERIKAEIAAKDK